MARTCSIDEGRRQSRYFSILSGIAWGLLAVLITVISVEAYIFAPERARQERIAGIEAGMNARGPVVIEVSARCQGCGRIVTIREGSANE